MSDDIAGQLGGMEVRSSARMPWPDRVICGVIALLGVGFLAYGPFDGDAPESIGAAVFGLGVLVFAYCAATAAYVFGITTPGGGQAGVTVPELARAVQSSEEREALGALVARLQQAPEAKAPAARRELSQAARELEIEEIRERAYLDKLVGAIRRARPELDVTVQPDVQEPGTPEPGFYRPDIRVVDLDRSETPVYIELRFSSNGRPVHVFGAAEGLARMNPKAPCPGIVVYRGELHQEEEGLSEASFNVKTISWSSDQDNHRFIEVLGEAIDANSRRAR